MKLVVSFAILIASLIISHSASAQLRIVTYNTNTFGTQSGGSDVRTIRDEADIIFQAIGEEVVNGFARPADIILLQEQQRPSSTTQDFVNRLNSIYSGDGITYARGSRVGVTTSGDGTGSLNNNEIRQSVVYRTDSVSLINEDSFGNIGSGTTDQPRETLLHQFRPLGYGANADLYLFNSHFKSGDSSSDRAQQEGEADQIRSYIDNNGLSNSNVIVGGDLNVSDNFNNSNISDFGGLSSLEILAAAGDGRVLDPLFPNGDEVDFSYVQNNGPRVVNGVDLGLFLTQSPANQSGPLVGGGIDDRFDFLLQSEELLDNEGVASIASSLHTFGNNGSTENTQINNGNTISFNGVTSFSDQQVLDALSLASDHLPVVQDFQLPAILAAELLEEVPLIVEQNASVDLALAIRNAADVLVSLGADELDFEFETSGDIFGSASGIDQALGGSFNSFVGLDTTQLGMRSGTITVTSDSQNVANGLITIPVAFQVVSAVPEPGSVTIIALFGIAAMARRRR